MYLNRPRTIFLMNFKITVVRRLFHAEEGDTRAGQLELYIQSQCQKGQKMVSLKGSFKLVIASYGAS